MKKERLNGITQSIIGAAIEAHRALGPGLLESAYEACLAFELVERGHRLETQRPLQVVYKDVERDCGYRLDLLVADSVVVEAKAIERTLPIHEAQLLSSFETLGLQARPVAQFQRDCSEERHTSGRSQFAGIAVSAISAYSAVIRNHEDSSRHSRRR